MTLSFLSFASLMLIHGTINLKLNFEMFKREHSYILKEL